MKCGGHTKTVAYCTQSVQLCDGFSVPTALARLNQQEKGRPGNEANAYTHSQLYCIPCAVTPRGKILIIIERTLT